MGEKDTPTTAAHWRIVDIEETTAQFSAAGTGANTSTVFYKMNRKGKIATFSAYGGYAAAIGTFSFIRVAVPTRFRPNTTQQLAWGVAQNGAGHQAGFLVVKTDGFFDAQNINLSNFTGVCGFSASNAVYQSAAYYLS